MVLFLLAPVAVPRAAPAHTPTIQVCFCFFPRSHTGALKMSPEKVGRWITAVQASLMSFHASLLLKARTESKWSANVPRPPCAQTGLNDRFDDQWSSTVTYIYSQLEHPCPSVSITPPEQMCRYFDDCCSYNDITTRADEQAQPPSGLGSR